MRVFVLLAVAVWWAYAMPAFVEEALTRSGIPRQDVSLLIERSDGKRLAALNLSAPRTPASVVKLFTTYAALRRFGFDYRFPTRFFADGEIREGVLYGDLYVKGYGDPTLSDKDLPEIVAHIKEAGIVRIEGDIVIDRTYFRTSSRNSARFDENPYSPYNAMPDALMFNERVSTVCVYPKQRRVEKRLPDRSYVVRNELRYVNRACRGRYAWPRVKIEEREGVTEVKLWGKVSRHCKKRELCQVVTQPYKSFYYALRDALEREGIVVTGGLRLKRLPVRATPLFTHYSMPLEKIVAKTAKKSNNLYARHLFLALGARMFGAPATLQKARRAVELILRNDGIETKGLFIDNGSGLSRKSRLTARNLASLLRHAYARYGNRWAETLSVAGKDGTIKRRFRGTVVAQRAWMKTGTLKHAKNIAGYVRSLHGKLYYVVILVNSRKPRYKAAKFQDDVIEGVVRGFRSRRKSSASVTVPTKYIAKRSPSVESKRRGRYYIQVGTFNRCPSSRYSDALRHMKLHVVYRKKGGRCKVLAGPFVSSQEARRYLQNVKKSYPDAFIVQKKQPKTSQKN